MCQWLIQYLFGWDQRWTKWRKYKSKFKCIKAASTQRAHVNWSQMVEAFSVHRPFPIFSVAYHNDCPLENVLRHLNMRTEHYKWQRKNLTGTRRGKKTERNEMKLYLFIFDFLVKCRLPLIPFHSIWFIFMELFLISLMEKLCKLLALFSLFLIGISFLSLSLSLSLMLTNYKHTRDGLPTRI